MQGVSYLGDPSHIPLPERDSYHLASQEGTLEAPIPSDPPGRALHRDRTTHFTEKDAEALAEAVTPRSRDPGPMRQSLAPQIGLYSPLSSRQGSLRAGPATPAWPCCPRTGPWPSPWEGPNSAVRGLGFQAQHCPDSL